MQSPVCNRHAPPYYPMVQVREVIETRNLLTKQVYTKEEELKAYLDERRVPDELKLRAKEAYNFYLVRPVLLPPCPHALLLHSSYHHLFVHFVMHPCFIPTRSARPRSWRTAC